MQYKVVRETFEGYDLEQEMTRIRQSLAEEVETFIMKGWADEFIDVAEKRVDDYKKIKLIASLNIEFIEHDPKRSSPSMSASHLAYDPKNTGVSNMTLDMKNRSVTGVSRLDKPDLTLENVFLDKKVADRLAEGEKEVVDKLVDYANKNSEYFNRLIQGEFVKKEDNENGND